MDRLNSLMVALLHAPALHWLVSPGLATITLEGRRSGRRFRFPVGYHDQDGAVVVLCSNAAARRWWRNFREPWPAELRIRGRTRRLVGTLLEPGSAEYAERVGRSFARARFISRNFGFQYEKTRGLTPEQLEALRGYAAVVCFRAP